MKELRKVVVGTYLSLGTTSLLEVFSQGNARLCTSGSLVIIEGTKLGFGLLKKVSSVPFFFSFAFLSRFAWVSRQIFVPR
jgi:hypothetical protein